MEMVNIILLSSLLIISSSGASAPMPSSPPTVKRVCDLTPAGDAPFCNSFISKVVKNNGNNTDPASILMACINRCIVETYAATKKFPPSCSESVEFAHDYLKEALTGFKNKDLIHIRRFVTAARIDSTDCVDYLGQDQNVGPAAKKAAKNLDKKILTCELISMYAKKLILL